MIAGVTCGFVVKRLSIQKKNASSDDGEDFLADNGDTVVCWVDAPTKFPNDGVVVVAEIFGDGAWIVGGFFVPGNENAPRENVGIFGGGGITVFEGSGVGVVRSQ
jgi:hypothetical protein